MNIKKIKVRLSELGINSFICHFDTDCIRILNPIFGLDPNISRYLEYGVDSIHVLDDVIYISVYYGSVFSRIDYVISDSYFYKKTREICNEEQEQAIERFFDYLFDRRERQIMSQKSIIENYNSIKFEWLEIARKHLSNQYEAELRHGNSLSDKRKSDAIVITKDNWQVGYIKIFVNSSGDVIFDASSLGVHAEYKVVDIDDIESYIKSAIEFITN